MLALSWTKCEFCKKNFFVSRKWDPIVIKLEINIKKLDQKNGKSISRITR